MAATHQDALIALQEEVPGYVYRFAETLTSDPEMSVAAAARAAGKPGQGAQLLRDRRTQLAIAALVGVDREIFRDQRQQALRLLALMCAYDPAEAFDQYGEVKSIHDIPPEVRVAIESYERDADGKVKIKFTRRLDALKLFMAHFGDIDDSVHAVSGTVKATFHFEGRGPLE